MNARRLDLSLFIFKFFASYLIKIHSGNHAFKVEDRVQLVFGPVQVRRKCY